MHSVGLQMSFASRGTLAAAANKYSPVSHSEAALMIVVESSQRMRCNPNRVTALL
jgi:hypothetical protein